MQHLAVAALVAVGVVIQKLDKVGGSYLSNKRKGLRNMLLFDVTGAFSETGETAISTAIKEGGRVFAMRLDSAHNDIVEELANNGKHSNVFTDRHDSIPDESSFVRDIVGAGESEMVVMKAGAVDESETFFDALSRRVDKSQARQ